MRYNIVKSQLEAFIIRPISAVFQPGYTNASVIIRARDSFQPGHIPDNRIDERDRRRRGFHAFLARGSLCVDT